MNTVPPSAIHRVILDPMDGARDVPGGIYLRVRRAVMVEGMSSREASRVFGLHRDTVRKMLAYSVPPGYRRQTTPKKRLVKADAAKREAFVAEYAFLPEETRRSGARIFFADEAHFRADVALRGKWVLRGEPALVDSSSPRRGEKASCYSAVCLETGEVEWSELEGNSNAGTSAAFLMQLRQRHVGPLNVIWDNAPAHRGEAVREYLGTPSLGLRLVNPRFHEGRLCRATARTSTGMR